MTTAQLIMLAIQASIALVLFGLGLAATFADLTHVLRRPWLLLRSLLAMSVVMLLVAVVLVKVMALPHAVAAALVALALAPVPPLLPTKQVKAGGRSSYAIGLLVSASLLAIVWIPLALELIDPFFPADLSAPLPDIAGMVFTMLLAPLATGFLVRQLAPAFADRILPLVHKIAPLLLLVAAIPVLFTIWPQIMAQIGDGTLVALVAFAAIGLLVGHLLGGPDPDDRTVLALASAGHHPGIAIALARMNATEDHAVPAAVVLYLLVFALVTLPYVAWRKRKGAAHAVSR